MPHLYLLLFFILASRACPPKYVCFVLAGISIWTMILVIILAILAYYYMQHKEDLLARFLH